MSNPENLKYTEEHEWLNLNDKTATIGITHYAQEQLGDIVYVELPVIGTVVASGGALGVVESTKSVSDFYSPVAGKVIEVNSGLTDAPEKINAAPYTDGWLVKLQIENPSDLDKLMTSTQYQTFTTGQH